MSTKAIVIDSRENVKDKGFRVNSDGHPRVLGVALLGLHSKEKSIELMYSELVDMWTRNIEKIYSNTGYPKPNFNNMFYVLPPEVVKAARKLGIDGLWKQHGIIIDYIYRIRKDGITVSGIDIPKPRLVRINEA